jgi:hypothetical protein
MQLATSFLPAAVACGTRLAERDTGPGGIYDLLEDMGHRPLAWEESVGARMPTPAEAGRLGLPKGIPLLRIVRMTTGPDGSVLEVNDTRMSAEAFEVGYSVTRHPSAEPTPSVPASAGRDYKGEVQRYVHRRVPLRRAPSRTELCAQSARGGEPVAVQVYGLKPGPAKMLRARLAGSHRFSASIHGMRPVLRRKCPAHGALRPSDAATNDCTCGIRAAVAVHPIPMEAVRIGAAVGGC